MAVNLEILLNDKKAVAAIQNLIRETIKLEKGLDMTGNSGDQAFDEISTSANKAEKNIEGVVKETDRLTKETNKAGRSAQQLGKAQKPVSGLRKGFRALGAAIKNAFLPLLAIGAIIQELRRTVAVISDFDQATANLAAVTGKSVEEIGALTAQAKELGATTAFTATEVTALQTQLAKLGFAESEILASTGAIQNLAIAAGGDLARAASLAGSTLRAFELDASEAGRVVDVIAKSFSISALDIDKFETAISTVAPVANSAGVSIEETTALLGSLVDAGIDASTAGTGLRNVFLEVAKEGITVEDALSKIANASDKNAVALDLFGKRGATVGTVLANNTDKAEAYTRILENAAGASDEFARKQLDTLSGQFTLLRSAFEGFILSLDSGEGVISNVLRSFTRLGIAFFDFLNVSRDARTEGQKQVDALKNQAAQADVLFTTLKNVKNELKDAKEGTEEYNRLQEVQSQVLSELNKEYGEYLPNLLTQKSSIQEISEAQKELNRQLFREQLIISFKEEINAAIEREIEARKNLTEAARSEASELRKRENEALAASGASAGQLQQQQQLFTALSKGVRAVNEEELSAAQESQIKIKSLYKDLFSEIGEDFETLFLNGGSEGGAIIDPDGSTPASKAASKLQDEVEKLQSKLEEAAKQASIELIDDPEKRIEAQFQLAKETIEAEGERIEGLAKEAGREIDIRDEIKTLILLAEKKKYEELLRIKQQGQKEIEKLDQKTLDELLSSGKELSAEQQKLFDGALPGLDRLQEQNQAYADELERTANLDVFENIKEKLANALSISPEELEVLSGALVDTFDSVFSSISSGIDSQVAEQDRLISSIQEREKAIRDSLDREIQLQKEGYANNVKAKERELAELQAAEEEAVRKRNELKQKQIRLELLQQQAQQAVNLATAVSKILEIKSGIPFVGIALAAASIASMFSLFQQAKAKASEASVVPSFYTGGSIRDVMSGYVEKGGKSDVPGRTKGYRVIDDSGRTRMRMGGSEFVMNELTSREHEPFLRELNAGKYKGVDLMKKLTIDTEPIRIAKTNNEVIVQRQKDRDFLTEKQMDKLLMKLADRISQDQDLKESKGEINGKLVIEKKGRKRVIR